eukprot:TRINITY_DN21162_c0_g2_i1.p1 TRINITY_DN21162_c0_g2~~TRINITY_DN21162_c0_g2_i1.p1  ORF type:complete len:826 (-),score=162.82 TRINITY_DN21162_c0_g2_i1:340-2817(-)
MSALGDQEAEQQGDGEADDAGRCEGDGQNSARASFDPHASRGCIGTSRSGGLASATSGPGSGEFLRRKAQILASLDRSPKGSLDAPILGLLAWVNAQASLVTTSSCSGRIAVFLGSSDPSSSKGGEWLLISHEIVGSGDDAWKAITDGLRRQQGDESESRCSDTLGTFLLEPFLLHAECADATTAQRVLEVAREAGMRESGISLGRRRIMVQVRSLALHMEAPIAISNKPIVDRVYFDTLLRIANERLAENARRVERFWAHLRQAFSPEALTAAAKPSREAGQDALPWVLLCPPSVARGAKLALEERGWLDESRKMETWRKVSDSGLDGIGLPIIDAAVAYFESLDGEGNVGGSVANETRPTSDIADPATAVGADAGGGGGSVCCLNQQSGGKDDSARGENKARRAARVASASKAADLAELWRRRRGADDSSSVGANGAVVDSGARVLKLLRSDALPRKFRPSQRGSPGVAAAEAVARERESIASAVAEVYARSMSDVTVRSVSGSCAGSEALAALLSEVRSLPPIQWRGDVALLPRGSLCSAAWDELHRHACGGGGGGGGGGNGGGTESGVWEPVRAAVGARLLARQLEIDVADEKRSGAVQVLAGSGTGWVTVPGPRGVRYTFDVTRCMFCEGNAAEKARVAEWPVTGETILDMYAGIGFWTLPLLAAGAEKVFSCEWNADAQEALRRGIELLEPPQLAERCELLAGDNRREEVRVAVAGRCHRVMLGLIPVSRDGFPIAAAALREGGGLLHVHWNIEVPAGGGAEEERKAALAVAVEAQTVLQTVRGDAWRCRLAGVQRIKWFAPRIRHVRIDLACDAATVV